MLLQVYGDNSFYQLIGWVMVFAGLIITNEIQRRSKAGGCFFFFVLPATLTAYFIAIYIGAANGASWALKNPTYVHMTSWFHYTKLYAATAGCIGFMMLKYKKGIGKTEWFKVFPFVIVAINIVIAVCSDFESAIRGSIALANTGTRWWLSSEGVWLYGGWWNVANGVAGIINIFCMTGWWGIYQSKKKDDMLWPDMTWAYILAYDICKFENTYLNRANTLATWCMFAQVFPMFQDYSRFSVIPSLYADGFMKSNIHPTAADPRAGGVVAVASILINLAIFAYIVKRAKAQSINPYKKEVFKGTRDFEEAMARAA